MQCVLCVCAVILDRYGSRISMPHNASFGREGAEQPQLTVTSYIIISSILEGLDTTRLVLERKTSEWALEGDTHVDSEVRYSTLSTCPKKSTLLGRWQRGPPC